METTVSPSYYTWADIRCIGRRLEVIALTALWEIFDTAGYWFLTFEVLMQIAFWPAFQVT